VSRIGNELHHRVQRRGSVLVQISVKEREGVVLPPLPLQCCFSFSLFVSLTRRHRDRYRDTLFGSYNEPNKRPNRLLGQPKIHVY